MTVRRPDARLVALVAGMAAVALLVTVVVLRGEGLLAVVLALLCVLSAAISGVAVAAVRDGREPPAIPVSPPPADALHALDADTLETLGNREAVRAMRDRYRGPSADGEGR
ncbi:hypothetical protein [Micromonospora thermarum]|uniref:Uncharacterized protein n=1 Tax=Micromonospora thermarum TaxID=2720024 RepID=A0ABX0Z9I2_9ACTN|nr:hypothetical protein [Micromonospora thermarum]NJP34123.1 hypothetical protein [Micromonospora thermarum]